MSNPKSNKNSRKQPNPGRLHSMSSSSSHNRSLDEPSRIEHISTSSNPGNPAYPGGNGQSPQVFSPGPSYPTGYPSGAYNPLSFAQDWHARQNWPGKSFSPSADGTWTIHGPSTDQTIRRVLILISYLGVNSSIGSKGPHYHPYSQNSKSSSSNSKVETQPKSLGSSSLDALNSCVNSLNPAKVSPTLPTAKPKADTTVKTVSRYNSNPEPL